WPKEWRACRNTWRAAACSSARTSRARAHTATALSVRRPVCPGVAGGPATMPARFEQLDPMAEDRQPNPLLAALGRALEAALNRGVALDADMRSQLAGFEGRRIGVELRGVKLALSISVRDARLQVGPHWEGPGDLNLHASPGSLLAFALRRGDDPSPATGSPPGKVEISGDAELARRIEK